MNANLFWCIAGIIGGAIASFIISYFFYFRSLTRKCLTYDIKTLCIVSDTINQINGLEVKYNSNNIENLYSSKVTIKNIGNSVIQEQDVAPLCPISITTSGEFLSSEKEAIKSHPTNKISNYNLSFYNNEKINNYVKFNFDYIPKKAIVTFSLFHTGNIMFNGDLIEGKIITPAQYQRNPKTNPKLLLILIDIFICIILLLQLLFQLY